MTAVSMFQELDNPSLCCIRGGIRWDEVTSSGQKIGSGLVRTGAIEGALIGGIAGGAAGSGALSLPGAALGAWSGSHVGSRLGYGLGYAYGAGRNLWDQYHETPAAAKER